MPTPASPALVQDTDAGQTAAASRRIQQADDALSRGLRHHAAGRIEAALAAYEEALTVAPDMLAALVNKGVALHRLNRNSEAMACYWQALAINPNNVETWCNAGNALLDLNRIDEALATLKVALQRAPRIAEIWLAMATALQRRGQAEAAEVCLRRAVALAPKNIPARLRLAGLLEPNNAPAALTEFTILREMIPAQAGPHGGIGQALISLGRLDEAEPFLRHALTLNAGHLDAHLGLARLLLLKGDLAAGWPEYEWRRRRPDGKDPKLASPEWDGSDLKDKTILIYAEQGFGDTIQFIRYIPLLAERGARVVIVCQKSILRLVDGVAGVASAQAAWKPLPDHDFHVPLLTLPLRMGTTLETIPACVPYLSPPSIPIPGLAAPLGTRLRVGLVWAGSTTHGHDRDRSAGLEAMLPLTGIPGTTFYSLQVGPRAADLTKFAHPALIADLSQHLRDFADTAAVVSQLDLVITVDTAVAHLAGALGKPVWVLIPFSPDWRWQRDREDSPWYPSMRLFRQTTAGDWVSVIERLVSELRPLVAAHALPATEEIEIVVHSVFPKIHHEGTKDTKEEELNSSSCSPCLRGEINPRFRMTSPRSFLPDPGIRFLVQHERSGIGYEYATRSFLDAHLQPGDLFIDVGAHWGIMSLQAVTRWPGEIQALAIEPSPRNLPHLRRWIADNRVEDRVEIIAVAAADAPGHGTLKPESTMGHSLIKAQQGPIAVVTIDGLLAERPHLAGRRVIVKIDVEGHEPEVIAGMADLLASGRIAAVIWERGIEYNRPEGQKRLSRLRAHFDTLGYAAWRFDSENDAGPLVPFIEDGRRDNIFELASDLTPFPNYGHPRPASPDQPVDSATDKALQARQAFVRSLEAHKAGKTKEALALYAQAGVLDGTVSELYNNLGVALRNLGRLPAATASYRRALALSPDDASVLSNLGNVLREQGQLTEAEALHGRALTRPGNNAGTFYNAALVHRDAGRPEQALSMLDQSLVIDSNNNDCRWDRALALLQFGDYEQGFPAYEARWGLKRAKRRQVPLPAWGGEPLEGHSVFLTDEQGFGDVLQFARFIPELKRRGAGKITLSCQPELMRLMALAPGVDTVVPRDGPYPACDFTVPLLSLPGLFAVTLDTLPAAIPYLQAPAASQALTDDRRLKVGLAWAGKTTPRDRSIPLEHLLPLLNDPRLAAYGLQVGPRAADLKLLGADAFVTDLGPTLYDFAETAAVLSQLDLLITIDSAVVHLAGALGVPTFLLLRSVSDWRWFDRGTTSPWYPSLTLFRQPAYGDWGRALTDLTAALKAFVEKRYSPQRHEAHEGEGNTVV